MKKIVFLPGLMALLILLHVSPDPRCQKIPLDHSVYDGWQSIDEKSISSDGRLVVYTVNPQEGNGVLLIQATDLRYKKEIPRGYGALITSDSRFVIGKIRPFFKDTRDAKNLKRKPTEMPKDSLFIFEWGRDSVVKIASVKSYKTPEKSPGWVAWLAEKPALDGGRKRSPADSLNQLNNLTHLADSLVRAADSLRGKAAEAKLKGMSVLQVPQKKVGAGSDVKSVEDKIEEGTELTLRNLFTGEERNCKWVSDYAFGKKGNALVIATTRRNGDSLSKACVLWVTLSGRGAGGGAFPGARPDTVMKGFNEVRNFAFDEEGGQLAFTAERDSAVKALKKYYKLFYYKTGMDSAELVADRTRGDVPKGLTISENYALNFSKSGQRLFLGLAPVSPVKDTTVPDFEKAGLDIWNYRDDELQPVQLKNLDKDLKKSWLALWEPGKKEILQLGDEKFQEIQVTREGDGEMFYTSTDFSKRIARQWQGFSLSDVYAINALTGQKKLIIRDFKGSLYPSYTGKYLLLYNEPGKAYSVYNDSTGALDKIGMDIKAPLYDEENDVPEDPKPYGIAGWEKDDRHIYIYDRYDIWQVDPDGQKGSRIVNFPYRRLKLSARYVKTSPEEKFIDPEKFIFLRVFSELTKGSSYIRQRISGLEGPLQPGGIVMLTGNGPFSCNGFIKSEGAEVYAYTRESFSSSPDLHVSSEALDSMRNAGKTTLPGWHTEGLTANQLSHLNPQQSNYLWGTAELFTWKAYGGKQTEGVLYKPENFDPARKYPMIVYFYERNNNTLYNYQPPAPTPSRLNISFFVSRGYIVFVPGIWYTTGHPGKSAYDYIMSGTRALIKTGFVDSARLGLQGQSWGGFQTAYLVTRTNLFAAAWAGAPVVNMFSAYGGIRWETGSNRQFQYERTQSRIGATIWQRPDLYVENSPLFHLPKIKTPLVIMSNDADGAVPWYQGIEFFTAMRRLNKPIWLLEYNGEAHNLVERRNRKDIQLREQQFFDWLLKGAKPPKWILEGVPATLKGIDWGKGTE